MSYYYSTFLTRAGDFSVAVHESSAVVATAFGDVSHLRSRLGPYRLFHDAERTEAARQQILDYFSGQRQGFELPLAPSGTPFQQRVWTALLQIPFGETRSYGALAAHIGNPTASRAVGRANATNPLCLIVPCHRVIGADGALTGFAFGEAIKRQLLEHEGALRAAA